MPSYQQTPSSTAPQEFWLLPEQSEELYRLISEIDDAADRHRSNEPSIFPPPPQAITQTDLGFPEDMYPLGNDYKYPPIYNEAQVSYNNHPQPSRPSALLSYFTAPIQPIHSSHFSPSYDSILPVHAPPSTLNMNGADTQRGMKRKRFDDIVNMPIRRARTSDGPHDRHFNVHYTVHHHDSMPLAIPYTGPPLPSSSRLPPTVHHHDVPLAIPYTGPPLPSSSRLPPTVPIPQNLSTYDPWTQSGMQNISTPHDAGPSAQSEREKKLVWSDTHLNSPKPIPCRVSSATANGVCGQRFETPEDLRKHLQGEHKEHGLNGTKTVKKGTKFKRVNEDDSMPRLPCPLVMLDGKMCGIEIKGGGNVVRHIMGTHYDQPRNRAGKPNRKGKDKENEESLKINDNDDEGKGNAKGKGKGKQNGKGKDKENVDDKNNDDNDDDKGKGKAKQNGEGKPKGNANDKGKSRDKGKGKAKAEPEPELVPEEYAAEEQCGDTAHWYSDGTSQSQTNADTGWEPMPDFWFSDSWDKELPFKFYDSDCP